MSVSLNSVLGFNSTLLGKYKQVLASSKGLSPSNDIFFIPYLGIRETKTSRVGRRRSFHLSVAERDQIGTNTNANASSVDSLGGKENSGTSINDSVAGPTQSSSNSNGAPVLQASTPKRSPLTARERLKAARVLSRYTESKASGKPDMGSKVLDALRESDRGKKRSGLPEAPTNLFDDSKRGLPKPGWTFQFPGGNDLLIILVSFVLISTIMFTTTYIVWKVGAIHFNEY